MPSPENAGAGRSEPRRDGEGRERGVRGPTFGLPGNVLVVEVDANGVGGDAGDARELLLANLEERRGERKQSQRAGVSAVEI